MLRCFILNIVKDSRFLFILNVFSDKPVLHCSIYASLCWCSGNVLICMNNFPNR